MSEPPFIASGAEAELHGFNAELAIIDDFDAETAAQAINRQWRELTGLVDDVVARGRLVVDRAIQLGERLIAQKGAMEHGEWSRWVQENCEFTLRHAQKLMGLARKARTINLESANGMRQAYQLVGILPIEEGTSGAGSGDESSNNYLASITRAELELKRLTQTSPIENWPDTFRVAVRRRVEPFALLFKQLGGQIGPPTKESL